MSDDVRPAADPFDFGSAAAPDEAKVREALHQVLDPEMGESIVDLGLVHAIDIRPGRVQITLIPTSATCPMGELLAEDAGEAVRQVCPRGTLVEVMIDWDTPWDAQRMHPGLKSHFGW